LSQKAQKVKIGIAKLSDWFIMSGIMSRLFAQGEVAKKEFGPWLSH
jgi:hypothetical protein